MNVMCIILICLNCHLDLNIQDTITYALTSVISTVTFPITESATLVLWLGGDLFERVPTVGADAADEFPLLPRLPRRDPVRDPEW